MSEKATSSSGRPGKARPDRWVKLGFLVVALVVAGVLVVRSRSKPLLPDWDDDLPAALTQARQGDRKVLVMFHGSPPGETARRLATTTLRKEDNLRAIRDGKFLRVEVTLPTSLDSDAARRYRIRKLPTMLILTPSGQEWNRREGMIGEEPFRRGFLDGSEIVKP
jgi:hypothetical protein